MKRAAHISISLALLLNAPALSHAQDWNNPPRYGSDTRSEGAFIGTFYDFKQTQQRQPTGMTRHNFETIVSQFLNQDWDEGVVNQFYRITKPLYTTEFQMAQMNSDLAPRAFGVDRYVKAMMWIVWYKGQVVVPEDGTYRFLGNSDDFCAVAINGKTVMFDHMPGTPMPLVKWLGTSRSSWGGYSAGDWITLKAGQVVDIDIMTGDSPGGDFRCLIGVEKQGVNYNGRENPFQLSLTPKSLPTTVIWKGLQ